MKEEILREDLNPAQAEAALTIEGPLLIIAGAGSGKTRATTYRIAYMLSQGIEEKNILALTFTNKAAGEMRDRIENLLGKKTKSLQILTFHAFGLFLLRQNAKKLGYKSKFSIYDSSDKLELIKEVAEHQEIMLVGSEANYMADLFSRIKNGQSQWEGDDILFKPLFEEYESFLKLYNAFDFDDLISKSLLLLKKNPEILKHYQNRYQYILVDEFQDTSLEQYELLSLLAREHSNLCCVGDDDQSIYSWRGANYENIRLLEKDFPFIKEIKLEQNYRSTQLILEAANAVIRHNQERKDKSLWSDKKEGKAIAFSRPANESEEALFIAQQIQWLALHESTSFSEVAILVRTNSLFREIEIALRSLGIEYQISGGSSFFQKKEIKDVIAYLRVMVNPNDDFSLLRILNTPRRGIGKETLQLMRQIADKKEQSLYESLKSLLFNSDNIPLSEKAILNIQEFIALLEEYENQFEDSEDSYSHILKSFLVDLGYFDFCFQESTSEAQGEYRIKNLDFFLSMMSRWEAKRERNERDLEVFLNMISLQTREDNEESKEDQVSLMTIHASKGLEWDIVFLAGVEEEILPHNKTIREEESLIEEERRLFYVALTRARKRVVMTAVESRKKGKESSFTLPSRFIEEIPTHLIEKEGEGEPLTREEIQEVFKKFFKQREEKIKS